MIHITCGVSRRFRQSIVSLVAVIAAIAVATPADARRHNRNSGGQVRHAAHHGVRDTGYSPPYAAIVVDANSGKTLTEKNADSLRHPASLTKIMTLYLLFEQLDAGKLKLTTMMPVSEHAAEQAPTKLDLRTGQSIEVEDAIRGLVTRSANDAAVVIAEAIGGDEASFAKMMTRKARALGMSRTTYMNASGLPDDDQLTTARDQALLGRAIQERFPRYYRYFSTTSFVFRGEEIRNHNHLLGRVDGVDGIKTGYTHASGFNLVTSVRRNNRHVVAVVLGGSSAGARDARMRELIEGHIAEASTQRGATMVADAGEAAPAAPGGYALSSASSVPVPAAAAAKARAPAGSSEPIKPIAVKTIKVKLAPVQTATLAPAATMIPITEEASAATPAPATAAAAAAVTAPAPAVAAAQPAPPPAPQPAPQATAQSAPQPTPQPWIEAKPDAVKNVTWPAVAAAPAAAPAMPATPAPVAPAPSAPVQVAKAESVAPPSRSLQVHSVRSGWIIQIGAYDTENEAKQHLDAAQSKAKSLTRADPFTETVTKGDKTYFRARFAGLEKSEAEATCKQLRRSDIECMALKN